MEYDGWMSESIANTRLSQNSQYYTRIASSDADLNRVFKIRYQVFYKELEFYKSDKGDEKSEAIEKDTYDQFCDYILLISKDTEEIVGLYRILPYFKMDPSFGYYSGTEFDLTSLMNDPKYQKIADLGRLAILQEHRGGTNLLVLWLGLVRYCQKFGIRYLVGTGSLPSDMSKEQAEILFQELKRKNQLIFEPDVRSRKPSEMRKLQEDLLGKAPNPNYINIPDDIIEFDQPLEYSKEGINLPRLITRYLQVGAKVIGYPTFDVYDSGCFDFFIMIDLKGFKARLSTYYVKFQLFVDRIL